MDYNRIKITDHDGEKEYITLEEHKRLVGLFADRAAVEQMLHCVRERFDRPYSRSNPYFIRLGDTQGRLIRLEESLKEEK